MGRWEPNAQGRMMSAALDLFGERGFERTTAGDIAQRAGVTERTFFRHFADKREVLFDGSGTMEHEAERAIRAVPHQNSPLSAAVVGMRAACELIEGGPGRDRVAARARIIAGHPSLQERELLKMAALVDRSTEALVERGDDALTARVAAHVAVAAFQVAFARWLDDPSGADLVMHLDEAVRALRAVDEPRAADASAPAPRTS